MQTATTQGPEAKPLSLSQWKRTCVKCGHFKVCTLTRAVAPLLANWEEGQRPFESVDLAGICLEYVEPSTEGL